jgi:hypothetical protein
MKRILLSILAAVALLPGIARAETIFGLTSTGAIFSFNSSNPATITGLTSVTGTGADTLVGIDFRPATGALYGFASSGNLYRIDPFTGVATLDVTPAMSVGTVLYADFNPVVDRVRIVSAGNQNYRLTPGGGANAGMVNFDGNFEFAPGSGSGTPNLRGVAYTNSFAGTTSTSFYSIDANNLYLNSGGPQFNTLNLVGSLGLTLTGASGFDISGATNIAYLTNDNAFYTVNLATGATTFVGTIGGGVNVVSIAAVPEPGTNALLIIGAVGAVVFLVRRRTRAA